VAPARRLLALAALFVLAASAAWYFQAGQSAQPDPRWPTADGEFGIAGWQVSPAAIERANGNVYVTREYQQNASPTARVTFVLTTSEDAKSIYRAGADVPFLGSGFEAEPVPAGLVPVTPNRGPLLMRRREERWLQIYAYGERRGMLGNGLVGWSLATIDSAVGTPKDYYLLRALVPLSDLAAPGASQVVEIADTLFPRLAEWYAR
jgi:hypothetical protein